MITLDGTNGITTPDVDTDGLTVDTNTLFVDAANDRVGVGTSSPSLKLSVDGDIWQGNGAGTEIGRITNAAGWYDFGGSNNVNGAQMSHGAILRFLTNNTERARIDASGNLLVGTTTASVTGAGLWLYNDGGSYGRINFGSSITGSSFPAVFYNNVGSAVGSISYTTTTTTFGTSSDYRLKEDVQPMVGSVDRLMALKPVNFAWKINGERVDGFLAHEAQEVVPECVTGEKDAVDDEGNPQYQGIDQSKIVPLLVAALQEALTKIEALEARVAALETNA
jgi:hypothetical protein